MREEIRDGLAIMGTTNRLRQGGTNINRVQLWTNALLILMRNGIGHDHLFQNGLVDDPNGLAAEDSVRDHCVDG